MVLSSDFNSQQLNALTAADLKNDWGATTAEVLKGGIDVVKDPAPSSSRGKVLRSFFAAGAWGYRNNSGGQWLKKLNDYDELYIAYDVYVEPGFDFVKGGKLGPSLRSTDWIKKYKNGKPAGTKPDGTDFWSAALGFKSGGELEAYVYHANGPKQWGQHIAWDDGGDKKRAYLTRGKWHRIELRVKLNTPGKLDGRLQGWFNGAKRLDRSKIMFRKPGGEHLKIGTYFFYSFMGGGNSTFAPRKDQHMYFDNLVISTKPITH